MGKYVMSKYPKISASYWATGHFQRSQFGKFIGWVQNDNNAPQLIRAYNGHINLAGQPAILITRESTKAQFDDGRYQGQLKKLQTFCKTHNMQVIETCNMCGSAVLSHLDELFNSLYLGSEFHVIKNVSLPYFAKLETTIRKSLQKYKQIYVCFTSKDRVIRPCGFKSNDASNHPYTDSDYILFLSWLNFCFGEDVKRINFVFLGKAKTARSEQTKWGMENKGKMGGRPKITKPGEKKATREAWEPQVIDMAGQGYTMSQIMANIPENSTCDRNVRRWLQKAGMSRPNGRPQKKPDISSEK